MNAKLTRLIVTRDHPHIGRYAPMPKPVARRMSSGYLETPDRRSPDRPVLWGLIASAAAIVVLASKGLL